MICRPASPGDLRYILAHLSRQSQADLAAHGLDEDGVFRLAVAWLSGATTHWLDSRPAMIFGVLDTTPRCTWFLATQPFFDTLSSVRYARRWLADHHRGEPLVSVSRNPAAKKWFRVLGFEIQSEKDGEITYVYKG